jgi:DNA polymerase III subunit delta'
MDVMAPLPWQRTLWGQLVGLREVLPHALLLHGARGIGKRRLAEAFAHYLLCEAPTADAACGKCPGCQLLAADSHPDLRRLIPAADANRDAGEETDDAPPAPAAKTPKASREIRIDQVREIADFLSITAHRGGRRVVLLAPAEALNPPASNALLKLLEEPPPGAFFIAVTDRLDALLPTIVSRCVLLRISSPTRAQALSWLQTQSVDNAEGRLAEAGGAPIGLEVDDDARALDPGQRDALLQLLRRGAAIRAADVVTAVARDVAVAASIRLLQRWGWDLLAERMGERVRYYPGERRAISAIARTAEPVRVLGWLAELIEAQRASDHPLNARLVVERLLLRYVEVLTPPA